MGFELHKGSVRLGAGHSLIIGHAPQLSELSFDEAKAKQNLESFGLFNMATPDSVSYYQNVSAEDLKPKAEDYIRPLFRGLSETIVRKQYDPIDFGHEKGVLKASMGLMVGQTVFSNHEAFVGNEKGVVADVFWDNGHKADGFEIPAGFNMEFLIDGKIHTKLVRELQAPIPMVHSNSVTVQFGWKQSHPKMDLNEFRSKVGTFDDKGDLIRRVVNEIYSYNETSLVAHGADPYAQMIKDGKIVNPKYAHARDSFTEQKHIPTYFAFDWKESLSENTIPKFPITSEEEDLTVDNPNMKNLKGLILLLATMAGISLTDEQKGYTDEEFATKFDFDAFNTSVEAAKLNDVTINGLKEEIETLTTEKTELEAEKTTLETTKTELEKFKTDNEPKLALVEAAEGYKGQVLSEVQKYHALINGKPDEAMNATLAASNITTLLAFKETFTKQLEGKFPSSCKKCGNTEIVKNSASVDDDEDSEDKTKGTLTLAEIRKRAGQQTGGYSLHGE